MRFKITLLALAALSVAAVGVPRAGFNPKPASAQSSFSFNWTGTPSAPLPWTPGQVNDWDAYATSDVASDLTGTMPAQHGADCAAPPATHQINQLAQSMYICNNHMMTALFGGGDGPKDYNAAYFTPNQMVDLSSGTAQINFQVSTQRQAPRDWWDLWITPYGENLAAPLQSLPAFNGPPRDAVHLFVDNTYCNHWQAYGTSSQPWGSMVRENTYTNFQPSADSSTFSCIEDEANARGDAAPSPTVRSPFELDVSKSHLRFYVVGQQDALADLDLNLPASYDHAVVQWGHHSYNPQKDCPGPCGPNTFHWSNVSISPAVPFTIERLTTAPSQSVHDGVQTSFALPQPAPAGSNLRFIGLGETQVSFDGGTTWTSAALADQDGPNSDGNIHLEQNRNYWTAVPEGATSVVFRGQPNGLAPTWWVDDPAVWSQTAPGGPTPTPTSTGTPTPTPTATPTPTPTATPTPTPTPTATPTPTPTATPTPTPTPTPPPPPPPPGTSVKITNQPCTVQFPAGPQTGTCTGTFTAAGTSSRIDGFFQSGANMPWLNFGSDFGANGGNVANNLPTLDAKLQAAHDAGMHVVRWWMFEGGSPQIQRNSNGVPTGLNQSVYADIDAAVAEAAKYDIYFDFVLFDGTNDDSVTHTWWTNGTDRTALKNVLVPLFQHYANQSRINTWEIVNEPDWQIRNGQTTATQATTTVNLLADAVHANSKQLVTVGQAQIQDIPTWVGSHIDYYSPHYYDSFGSTGGGVPFTQAASSPDGKPVVIGELQAGAGLSPTAQQRYQALYDLGYAGAWAWSLNPAATADGFDIDGAGTAAFAAGKTDVGPHA